MESATQSKADQDFTVWWNAEKNKAIPPMEFRAILDHIASSAWHAADIRRWQTSLPATPSNDHLASMAMRYRHDFGLLDESTKAAILVTMKQLFEEATGRGFYQLPEAPRQPKTRKQIEIEMMSECTVLLRHDLIEAGIIKASVAPMFLTEAILHAFQQEKLKTPESVLESTEDQKLVMKCELGAVIEALESTDRETRLNHMDALRIVKKAQDMLNKITLAPLAMELNCPSCNKPHADEGVWASKPHKTHQCQHCNHTWKPFDYPTAGIVKAVESGAAPSLAAIQYAITLNSEAANFLQLWSEGDWDGIRKEWPECPESVFDAATIETQPADDNFNELWQPLTGAGQVNSGDKLRFSIGDQKHLVLVSAITDKGTVREELIYDLKKNYYLITSMVISGESQAKNVEFMSMP